MAEAPREHADGAAGVPAVAEASEGQVGHAALYQRGEEAIVSENRRSAALATLCLVLFLTFLDITIVSVALAGLQTQLRAGVSSLQWVVGAYALTFASTMLAFGTIGDQFGRKKVLLIGICIFIAGALMSGLSVIITSGSSALAIVIAGRAVMGLGAAAIGFACYLLSRSALIELGTAARLSGLADALCISGDEIKQFEKAAAVLVPKPDGANPSHRCRRNAETSTARGEESAPNRSKRYSRQGQPPGPRTLRWTLVARTNRRSGPCA